MGIRKGGGGGGGGGGSANIKTIVLGVITIVISLIMLGIAMDVVSELLDPVTGPDFTNYPGAEAMLGLFPLLMMIALVLFGGIMIWIGYGGGSLGIKGSIMTTIVVVVAIILLPIVIDTADELMTRADIDDYTGLAAFLGLIPLLYVIGTLFVTGMLAYKATGGKIPGKGELA